MKIIFLGTPEIAIPTFKKLAETYTVCAVLTQPDRRHRRSKKLIPSPISTIAETYNISQYKPEKITPELITTLTNYQADIFVTFAYGIILKKEFFTKADNVLYKAKKQRRNRIYTIK